MITTAQDVVKRLAGGMYRCEDADEIEANVYRAAEVSSQAGTVWISLLQADHKVGMRSVDMNLHIRPADQVY